MSEEKELLEYACGKFENGAYGEALEAFVLSYEKGYEREWVLDNIYNCYMAGNEREFLKCYEGRNTGKGTAYEDCTLDFVPCREGEYFIFDKEERSFVGRLSVPALLGVMADPGVDAMEFSAAALAMDWDIRNAGSVLNASGEGTGIPAGEVEQVLGRRTRRALKADTILQMDDFAAAECW